MQGLPFLWTIVAGAAGEGLAGLPQERCIQLESQEILIYAIE